MPEPAARANPPILTVVRPHGWTARAFPIEVHIDGALKEHVGNGQFVAVACEAGAREVFVRQGSDSSRTLTLDLDPGARREVVARFVADTDRLHRLALGVFLGLVVLAFFAGFFPPTKRLLKPYEPVIGAALLAGFAVLMADLYASARRMTSRAPGAYLELVEREPSGPLPAGKVRSKAIDDILRGNP